jgi:MFS family permease
LLDTADILGAINGLFYFGAAVGSLVQSWLADWLGRVKALASAAVLGLLGSALVAGSVNIPMLFVMRILQGCGLGMLLALVRSPQGRVLEVERFDC